MKITRTAIAVLLAVSSPAWAAVDSIDLGSYQLTGTFTLPATQAAEASAVTYNWNSGTLFVLGDEGDALVEVSTTGSLIGSMTLTGFDDTEGLTYIGGGRFVLVEERLQDAYVLTYTAGGAVNRTSLQSASLGPTVGNVGLEGLSYDPRDGSFVVVKEKTPQAVYLANIDFTAGTAGVNSLFTPNLGVLDLSDVQVLSTAVNSGSADANNLLIYSQESALLMEVSRTGSVLSMFSLAGISASAEGVTIDSNGTIYIVDEGPNLYVLTPAAPVPLPAAAWLLISGIAGLAGLSRARRRFPTP